MLLLGPVAALLFAAVDFGSVERLPVMIIAGSLGNDLFHGNGNDVHGRSMRPFR